MRLFRRLIREHHDLFTVIRLPRRCRTVVSSVILDRLIHQTHKGLVEGLDLSPTAHLSLLSLASLISDRSDVRGCRPVPLLHFLGSYLCLYAEFLELIDNFLFLCLWVTHPDLYMTHPRAHPSDVILLSIHLDNMMRGEEMLFELHIIYVLWERLQVQGQDLHFLIVHRQTLQGLKVGWQVVIWVVQTGRCLELPLCSVNHKGQVGGLQM